ncbi:hypothetical protein D6D19_09988 [Aureobasidium pullulans]|uniref:Arginase/deacetylase n=1 Tax=Aureobasidium pullulans TaxID=5580 RepID=A0A4S8Z7S1_AURPU|nr:hypothetical protein D6D19_09988 [Aureobasidium pullulans]
MFYRPEAFVDLETRKPALNAGNGEEKGQWGYVRNSTLVTLEMIVPLLYRLRRHCPRLLKDILLLCTLICIRNDQSNFNYASVFFNAARERSLANGSCIHTESRTRLSGTNFQDYENDVDGIAERILTRVGTEVPMYLSIDVGVLDVAFAPGTGTPEAVGWSTRELIRMTARD